jgi:uncharacterized protein
VDLLEAAAEGGDGPAQNALGYMFRHGVAVDIDHHKARKLFEAAARQAQAEAEYYLGEYALEEEDYDAALARFHKAAEMGYLLAAYRQGQLLEAGLSHHGIPRSCPAAVRAYKVRSGGGKAGWHGRGGKAG